MLKKIMLGTLCLVLANSLWAQQEKRSVSGYVRDSGNGEELIGATIFVKELSIGTSTNVYGFYSLTMPPGKYTVQYSFVGYDQKTVELDLTSGNQQIDIEIGESTAELQAVEITDEKGDENVKRIEMSTTEVDIKTIEKIPPLLGEVDIVRSIQLLPGVSSVGEGASGFNVRGGGVDQNLVLLDEAPVYNSSHLFGFFSVFNPDAVKNVKLVKGGIAPQYGGRLSSLLDVRMKEGNKKKFSGQGGVGLIFSRLAVEAPIVKDKASFLVAGRRSYIDILAKPFLSDDLSDSKFNFYDLTAKVNWKMDNKNRFFLSGYFGRDVFDAGFFFNWGNATSTLRWNHIFNDRLFMNVTAFYSIYDYKLGIEGDDGEGFEWASDIVNYSVKPELTYFINDKNTLDFGGQAILYQFRPGDFKFSSASESDDISRETQKAIESALYIQNEQKVSPRLSLLYGLRFSSFQYLGSGTRYAYEEGTLGESKPLASEEKFDNGEVISTYNNLEPRLSAKYELNEKSSVKLSYNRMAQYIHLLSNTTASSPLDLWTPSTNNLKPQLADQIATGYFRNFGEGNDYEFSAEVYYKDLQNQIGYINNAQLFLNRFFEAELLYGDGRAYGLELYMKKNKGKLNGWISYTLARTERLIDGINLDEWYPARFDKTHNLNVVATYDLNDRLSFSANFVLQTGAPTNFPTNRYIVQRQVVSHNVDESRNGFRIEPYHRIDLSATLNGKKKEGKRFESFWVFSIYNVYARRNAFTIYFQNNEDDPSKTEAIRYSIIGTLVPSVSWNFKF